VGDTRRLYLLSLQRTCTQDFAFSGIARTNSTGTTLGPYSISSSNTANVTEPNHVIDQGFTL